MRRLTKKMKFLNLFLLPWLDFHYAKKKDCNKSDDKYTCEHQQSIAVTAYCCNQHANEENSERRYDPSDVEAKTCVSSANIVREQLRNVYR